MTDTELRRLAESATPGPWEVLMMGCGPNVRPQDGSLPHVFLETKADAAFIAAASPDVVIGLLDRCERAEKERDAARSEAVDHATDADARQLVVTALLSEGEAMRERIKALEVERDAALRERDIANAHITQEDVELDDMRAQRDARPAISREDASMFVDFDSERDAPHTWDDVQTRVYDALHAHAAKGGE